MNEQIPEGYILLARKIRKSNLWKSLKVTHKIILIELLLQAQFSSGEVVRNGEILYLERGQVATSYQCIVDDIGDKTITVKVVRNAIEKLIKHDFLAKDEAKARAKKGLLLTIVNYEVYQTPGNYKGKAKGNDEGNEGAKQGQSEGKARAINKNVNNVNNVNKKDYMSEIKEFLVRYKHIENFTQLNKEYWDVIRNTRVSKKVSQSVIHKNMNLWNKFDPIVVQYALKAHVDAHHGKREEYTVGIMRRTSVEEARDRLDKKVVPFAKKQSTAADINKIREMLGNE